MAAAHATHADTDSGLAKILASAQSHKAGGLNYAGDIAPTEAFQFLGAHEGILVDVRTTPEWQFIGTADLSKTRGKLLTISWKTYPGFAPNPQFAETLANEPGVSKDTPLFFLCRSGGRSLDAAVTMTAAGYRYCFNVEGGFEGEPDAQGHRGISAGWKAANLPWKQG